MLHSDLLTGRHLVKAFAPSARPVQRTAELRMMPARNEHVVQAQILRVLVHAFGHCCFSRTASLSWQVSQMGTSPTMK